MSFIDVINELCQLAHRVAGSPNEHRAAKIISDRLESIGLNPHVERFRWPPSYSWSLVVHFGLLIASEVVLLRGYKISAAILALITIISLWGEVSGRFILIGKLVPRIDSSNVIARFGAMEPMKKLVITAHMDTARSGMIFHPYITKFLWESTRTGVLTVPFFASVLLGVLIVAKSSGAGGFFIDILLTLSNLVVGISALLLIEREVSGKPICGANDNASGVAVALEVAQRLKDRRFKKLEVMVAFCGAGEVNAGGTQILLRNRPELTSGDTYIVNIDSVGRGSLKVSSIEGPVLGKPTSPECLHITLTAASRAKIKISTGRIRHTTDAYPALVKNAKAATIFGEDADYIRRSPKDTPENIELERLNEATELVLNIASQLESAAI